MTKLFTVFFFMGIICASLCAFEAWRGRSSKWNTIALLVNVVGASVNGHLAGLY